MENLLIEATDYTPYILFDCENHVLAIKGYSYPENTSAFYEPVFAWLNKYLAQIRNVRVTVNIEIVYFNSSSSKVLLDFFDLLNEEQTLRGINITVNWIYEEDDEDIQEFGEEFQEDFKSLNFNFVKK